jgi:hypothetical protein
MSNFIKRKHPRNGEKKKQRAKTKAQASRQPKKAGHKKEMEPLRTQPSTSCMKHINEREGRYTT